MPSNASTVHLHLARWPAVLVVVGSNPRELAPREAALLAWLAIEGPTPRARLAALLWPDSDAEAARNALRQRLFQLRKQVGMDLATGPATLALVDGVQHDLADSDTVLGEAVHDHSEAFGQWLAAQRLERSQRQQGRWAAQADAAERARDYDGALAWAQRLLASDAVSEVAHRRVMRLHYLRGDRAAALLAFDECERVLKHEVGARPDAQTMSLLAMIESATAAAPPAPLRSLPPGVLRPPRLVAREDAVGQVLAPLAQGQHVLLLAEAGLGKTRLMEECVAALGATTALTRAGARPGDAARPFALLARVLQALVPQPQALPEHHRAALAWVVPTFGPTPSGALQAAPFEAAVAHVLAGTGVLLLDDLHFADNASTELLLRCLAEPATRRWVMAARPAEMPAALQAWRDSAGMAQQAVEVQLHTLDEAGIAALVDSLAVDGLQGSALAPALARHTGGNPQFVLETVKALLLANGGDPGNTNAQAFASGQLPLPRTVGRLIHQRLRQLSPGALKLARLAAVAGQDLSPALAAHVLDQGILDLADPWAELEAAGVLRGNAFAHDLVSEGTLDTMPQVLAATLHEAVAQWLTAHEGEPARIAAHLRAAGRDAEAVPWLMKAAAHASMRIQLRDAAQFCNQAAAICRTLGHAEGELDALEAAVDALFDVELGERMEHLLQRLQTMPLPPAQRARALRSVAAVRHFKLEDDAALALGREALQLALDTQQAALELRIRYGLVQVLSHRRDLEASEALIAPVRGWVATRGDAVQRLQLACMEGWVLLASENFEAARDAWQTVARAAAELQRPRDEAMALNHLQVCWSLMGRFADGHEAGLRELAIVRHHRLGGTRNIYLDLNLSISALLLGRYAEAIAALERAESHGVLDQATLHLRRAALYLQLGQTARCLNELQPLLDGRVAAQPAVRFNANLLQLRWLLQQDGPGAQAREDAARQALARAAELASGTQRIDHAVRMVLLRGRIALLDRGSERARPLLLQAVSLAHGHGLRGIEAAARAWLAQALADAGDPAAARQQIEQALQLRDQGHVVDQMPGAEIDLIAIQLLQHSDPPQAAALLARATAWLQHTAQTEVPEAFRHGFLHLQPVHRQLLALKSPAAVAGTPLQGQSGACSANAPSSS
jgi:DNA-binding SARP family transcriptional activator